MPASEQEVECVVCRRGIAVRTDRRKHSLLERILIRNHDRVRNDRENLAVVPLEILHRAFYRRKRIRRESVGEEIRLRERGLLLRRMPGVEKRLSVGSLQIDVVRSRAERRRRADRLRVDFARKGLARAVVARDERLRLLAEVERLRILHDLARDREGILEGHVLDRLRIALLHSVARNGAVLADRLKAVHRGHGRVFLRPMSGLLLREEQRDHRFLLESLALLLNEHTDRRLTFSENGIVKPRAFAESDVCHMYSPFLRILRGRCPPPPCRQTIRPRRHPRLRSR